MDEHFRAFTFVDRITAVEQGARIRGSYTIPADVKDFPLSLAAEAIGQLAAWAAMAALDFKGRPVAGLVGGVEFLSSVRPGQTLELVADLDSVEADAVAYGGSAQVGGNPVIRLEHCVGPMLALDEFDDPQAVREHYLLLSGRGATPGGFRGVPPVAFEPTGGEFARCTHATLRVPEAGGFFADHFPRRPVFPGTLLMHANLQLASALAAELQPDPNGSRWSPRKISDVKLRAFTPPGETLDLEARLDQRNGDAARIYVATRKGKRVVGGARVLFAPEERT